MDRNLTRDVIPFHETLSEAVNRSHVIAHVSLDCKLFVTQRARKLFVRLVRHVNFTIVHPRLVGRAERLVAFQAHGCSVIHVNQTKFHFALKLFFTLNLLQGNFNLETSSFLYLNAEGGGGRFFLFVS